jgi:predicted AAA+ superfamily ATPase
VLARGFYPALWEDLGVPPLDFHRSYTATWLERDLRQALNVGSLRDFERFLRACAARGGQLLNKSELARDVGLSLPTVGEWLSVLEAAGLIVILEPWFANATKRLVKTPKLYFTDVGLQTFLLGLDARSVATWSGLGALWETFVLGELLRWRDAHHPEATLWFYRDRDGVEVDFVVQVGGALLALDAKSAELPGPGEARTLRAALLKLPPVARAALVTPVRGACSPHSERVELVSGWAMRGWLDS